MLVHPRTHVSMEVIKWILLFVLASALVLSVLTHAVGQTPTAPSEPRTLPDAPRVFRPVPMPRMQRQTLPPLRQHAADFFSLLNVIGLHGEQRHAAALVAWDLIEMPRSTASWKCVGQGTAYLHLQEFDQASRLFAQALTMDRGNAVAEYLLGVTRLAQATTAPDGPVTNPPRFELLNEVDPYRPPAGKDALLLDAVKRFQRAIVLADECDLDAPLLPRADQSQQWIRMVSLPDVEQPAIKPSHGLTVLDLVKALQAENYVAQAEVELEKLLLDPPTINYLRQIAQGELR